MSRVSLKLKCSGDIRRVSVPEDTIYSVLEDLVKTSFSLAELPLSCIKYTDDEGDLCTITNTFELQEAFKSKPDDKALTLLVVLNETNDIDLILPAPPTTVVVENKDDETKSFEPLQANTTTQQQQSSNPPPAAAAVPPAAGRSDRDKNWRRGGRFKQTARRGASWRERSGRTRGSAGYEFGDLTRSIISNVTDPAQLNKSLHIAGKEVKRSLHVAEKVALRAISEGTKLWNGAQTEGIKLWNGAAPYDVLHKNLKDFAAKIHAEAMKMLRSEAPYEWQQMAAREGACAEKVMQAARRDAKRLHKKFMNLERKEVQRIFREGMQAVRQAAEHDWRAEVADAVKKAKSSCKVAKRQARELVQMARRAQRKSKKAAKAAKAAWVDEDDSEDSDGGVIGQAKDDARQIKGDARSRKEIEIKDARQRAAQTRQETIQRARKSAESLKNQMLDVAKREGKMLKKAVLAEAKEAVGTASALKNATTTAAAARAIPVALPTDPPAYPAAAASAPPPSSSYAYAQQMELLTSMGFNDVAKNKILLAEHEGNLQRVCAALCGR